MATPINRPGVYVEEVASANAPVAPSTGDSVAVFIGPTDRGPVTGTKDSYVGKPTLVTGWEDFCAKFSFVTDTFTTVPSYSFAPLATATGTTTVTIATNAAFTSNPAYNLYVGAPLPAVGTAGATTIIPSGTYITGVNGTNSFTVNNAVTVTTGTAITIGGTNLPFKYAMKSFFDNGGVQAYVLRDVPTNADKATTSFVDQNGTQSITTSSNNLTYLYATAPSAVTLTNAVTTTATNSITVTGTVTAALGHTISGVGIPAGTTVTNVASQVLTLSNNTTSAIPAGAALTFTSNLLVTAASATPFANAEVGRVVNFSGVTGTFATVLASTNSYVITSVIDSTHISIGYNNTSNYLVAATQSTGTVVINGASVSTQATLNVFAAEPGIWGNNIWVGVTPDRSSGYFNLSVYYSTATTAATVTSSPLETHGPLSMNSADTLNYAVTKINGASKYITVTDGNSTASGNADLPSFTVGWNPASAVGTNGTFSWNASYTQPLASGDSLIKLGNASATKSTLAGATLGAEGYTANSLANTVLPKLDEVNLPLVMNYPYRSDTTTVSALATYAANRSDSFVVADYPLLNVSGTTATTTADVLTAINQWTTNTSYVATYYPSLSVSDRTSNNGLTTNIAPSGAVIGRYIQTDSSRGVFKAPAGFDTRLAGGYATSVLSLPSSDYDLINNNKNNLNIIRYIPGSGYCIMGARTVDNASTLVRYVPVRRTLGFIEYNLKQLSLFAVFEPNDQNLWNSVSAQLTGFLNDFWRSGGLAGTSEAQAYYVKVDSTNNTPTTITNGYLNIEVGVALGRPAEFVVIRVSQLSGSTNVTTSI